MTPRQRIMKLTQRVKQPVYAVALLYVVLGLVILGYGLIRGNLPAANIGFLFISGAVGAALFCDALSRLAGRVSTNGHRLEELGRSVRRIEQAVSALSAADPSAQGNATTTVVDLAAMGKGDPSCLTAATLNRSSFPRLATTIHGEPPAESASPRDTVAAEPSATVTDQAATLPEPGFDTARPGGVANKNLMRIWRIARREGDLSMCRTVYSTVVDTAKPEVVAEFTRQLQEVTDHAEQALRKAFTQRVADQDYAGALTVGSRIAELFAGHTMAAEFESIRPHLLRRVEQQHSPESPTPTP